MVPFSAKLTWKKNMWLSADDRGKMMTQTVGGKMGKELEYEITRRILCVFNAYFWFQILAVLFPDGKQSKKTMRHDANSLLSTKFVDSYPRPPPS